MLSRLFPFYLYLESVQEKKLSEIVTELTQQPIKSPPVQWEVYYLFQDAHMLLFLLLRRTTRVWKTASIRKLWRKSESISEKMVSRDKTLKIIPMDANT